MQSLPVFFVKAETRSEHCDKDGTAADIGYFSMIRYARKKVQSKFFHDDHSSRSISPTVEFMLWVRFRNGHGLFYYYAAVDFLDQNYSKCMDENTRI